MSKRFRLPEAALGVDHYLGQSFKKGRDGVVELPDRVAKDFERNGVLRYYDVVAQTPDLIGQGSRDDRLCSDCGFCPWPWQEACPRCGAEINREA